MHPGLPFVASREAADAGEAGVGPMAEDGRQAANPSAAIGARNRPAAGHPCGRLHGLCRIPLCPWGADAAGAVAGFSRISLAGSATSFNPRAATLRYRAPGEPLPAPLAGRRSEPRRPAGSPRGRPYGRLSWAPPDSASVMGYLGSSRSWAWCRCPRIAPPSRRLLRLRTCILCPMSQQRGNIRDGRHV